MFEKVLSEEAKKLLVALGESSFLNNIYLAGGTAIALHLGHRFSYDLDFFTPEEFDTKLLLQKLKKIFPDFQLEKTTWGTILCYIQGIRFSLFSYNYPLLSPRHKFLNVNIADIQDIVPMKIAAVSDRGSKRDFIDIYFVLKVKKILTLEQMLKLYDRKFKSLNQNKIHILKSLSYFEDADKDEMPKMIQEVKWEEVKKFFKQETKKLSNKLLK